MSNDLTKKDPTDIDGFAGWNDDVEGDERPQGDSVIQGSLLKFTNNATWVDRDGIELPKELELVAVEVARVVQKWTPDNQPDGPPLILEPDQKFPDIEEMNDKAPRDEWGLTPDKQPRGPYQAQHVLYLFDLKTMDKYTFPTSTVGGRIAVRELRGKIVMMRRLRGQNVYAVVELSDVFMNTQFGGRQRPHFIIKRWVRLGSDSGDQVVEALPASALSAAQTREALAGFAPDNKPTEQTKAEPELPLVQEPSLAEEMNDEIPDFGAPPQQTTPPPKTPAPSSPETQARPTARRDLKKKTPQKPGAKQPAGKKQTILDAG